MWLPREGRVVGIDWSGAADASRKVWAATIVLHPSGPRLESVRRPFSERGPEAVSSVLGTWLSRGEYDVAGLDFCFGLEASHLSRLGLPTEGPSRLGREVARAFCTPEELRAAVVTEKKRDTDEKSDAPFAPTNLRMYKQTYWGLRALAETPATLPPWSFAGDRVVVEVLPAAVARWLGCTSTYKGRGEVAKNQRKDLLARLSSATGMAVGPDDAKQIVEDEEGDACDAVLAALAAASAWAASFSGAPPSAAASGEGWIYTSVERPGWHIVGASRVPSRALTAAHEAGHAVVFAACGVPVDWVEIQETRVGTAVRHGWTEARENDWDRVAPLSPVAKVLRRALGKMGGVAGEMAAAVDDPQTLLLGAQDDLQQLGAALVLASLLPERASNTPAPLILAVAQQAYTVITRNRAVFDEIRRTLFERGRVQGDAVVLSQLGTWTEAEDQTLLEALRATVAGTGSN
ncbi:MAG: DUF429 domain-containing protein [Anaeromyxobacter sp.]|nr:DUF429 domain-containing protein [Anaeromyxobacter sp.]